MDLTLQRVRVASCVREASQCLLEASERAHDLKRFELSNQLLERSIELLDLAREILQPGEQPTPAEYREDVPF